MKQKTLIGYQGEDDMDAFVLLWVIWVLLSSSLSKYKHFKGNLYLSKPL